MTFAELLVAFGVGVFVIAGVVYVACGGADR